VQWPASGEQLVDIVGGTKHCFGFTIKDGAQKVWTWGQLWFDEEGKPKERIIVSPMEVAFKERVKQVSCGFDHSLFLTEAGEVLGQGKN